MNRQDWFECKIDDIKANVRNALSMGPFGSNITKDNFVEIGVPVIRGGNLTKGRFNSQEFVFLTEEKANQLQASNAVADDIVFTHRGTLGQVGIIPKNNYPRYVVSQSQMKLTCDKSKVEPLFIYYYFCAIGNVELLKHKSGSGVPAIASPLNTLRNLSIYLPPLITQKKISTTLSSYDDLIENNTRRIEIMEKIAQTIYREWFVNFHFPGYANVTMIESELGWIPEGWEISTIKGFADLFRGKSYASENLVDEGGLPFINLKCIQRYGGFRLDGLKRFSGEYKDTHVAKTGDIVMAVTDMTQERMIIARAARIPDFGEEKSIVSMDLVRIVSKDLNENSFLYSYFRFSDFADNVKQYANGANVLHLNPERIEEYKFVKPTKRIIREFCQIVDPIFKMIDVLNNSNNNLHKQRDLLLPKLISGEIVYS